ncbi:MAG: LytR/AlgR family response regulator transcription factor [Porcipelethomonas sp.]
MVRVAVIDDDKIICNELMRMLDKYNIKYEYDIHCDIFTSCEDFIMKSGTDSYSLIFLDIEFTKMNGIELSKKIRNLYKNMKMQIIFISSKSDYAMDLFDVQPFNFLLKPLDEEKVFSCLTKFLAYYYDINKVFEYTYENIRHRILINEIIYLESCGKKVIIHTFNKEIPFYGVFNEIAEQLKQQFIVIRRGLMVNLQHVVHSNYTSVELSNNMTFEISKSHRENVRERFCGQ